MVQCRSCGGTYEPILPDGLEYYHACPPLSGVELRQAHADNSPTLTRAQHQQLDVAMAFDRDHPPAAGALSAVDQVLTTLVVERPNRRDENVVRPVDPDKPAVMKRAGAGVLDLPSGGR